MAITIHKTVGEYRIVEHPTMGFSVEKFVKPSPISKGFWQQVSKWYMYKGYAVRYMEKLTK